MSSAVRGTTRYDDRFSTAVTSKRDWPVSPLPLPAREHRSGLAGSSDALIHLAASGIRTLSRCHREEAFASWMGIHAPSRTRVPSLAATFVATDDTWLVSGHRSALPVHTVRSFRRCLHPEVKVPTRSAWGTGTAPGDGCHPPFTESLRLMRHAAQVFSIQLSNVLRQSGYRSTLNGARQDSKDRGRAAQQVFVDHAPVASTPIQPS